MRHILLTCFGVIIVLAGLTNVVRGQILHPIPTGMPTGGPWVPIPFQESPVHDWAKYKQIDLHPYGWTYTGQGSWAVGVYIPSQPQPTYNGPAVVLPGPFEEFQSLPSGEDNYNYLEGKARPTQRDLLDPGAGARRILARPRQVTPETFARIRTLIAD